MPERRAQPWLLYALIAASIAMFGVEIASGASPIAPTPQQILDLGGNDALYTLRGEWWRLGSSLFLHFGILHVGLNMLCLWQARAIEPVFGRVAFLVIYVLSGLAGGIAALIATPDGVIAGASGSVFGIYGALGAKLLMHRAEFDPALWQKNVTRLATFLGLNLAIGITTPGISLSAHIGGFVVGTLVGVALLAGANAGPQRTRRALAIAALGLALTGIAMMVMKPAAAYIALDDFYTFERTLATSQAAAARQVAASELTEAQYVAMVERDVMPRLRRVRDEVRAVHDAPERRRPLLPLADRVLTGRLETWEAYRAALAEQDPDRRTALIEVYTRHQAETRQAIADFEAEAKRLGQ